MKKSKIYKRLRYYLRRLAYNFKLIQVLKSISRKKYDEKISASLICGCSKSFLSTGTCLFKWCDWIGTDFSCFKYTFFRIYYSGFCDFLPHQYPADDFGLVSNWAQVYGIYFYNRFHELAVYPVCS